MTSPESNISPHPASQKIAAGFLENRKGLERYLGSFCRSSQIEDVIQNALERMLRSTNLPDDNDGIRRAMYRHTHCAAVDLFRSESAYTARNHREAYMAHLPVSTPEDYLIEKEEGWTAFEALSRLSPKKQRHLLPRIMDELSTKEIAEQTGTPISTIKTSHNDSIRMIRAEMLEQGFGSGIPQSA
jgi:RNA polymerase sigma factor (sigma-70 family)